MIAEMGELSVKLTPPKRVRRWLIVPFGLLLVSLGAWCFWPRGDARFVGRWSVSDGAILPQLREIEFRSNGSARYWLLAPTRTIVDVSGWEWTIQDDVLEFTQASSLGGSKPELAEFLTYWRRKLSRQSDPPTRMRIIEVTADSIKLQTLPTLPGYEPQDIDLTRMRQ